MFQETTAGEKVVMTSHNVDIAPLPNVTAEMTTQFLVGEFLMNRVAIYVHLVILLLGLITNPMILIVLRKKRFGSK